MMAQPPFDRKVTFADIAFKGRLKFLFLGVLALGAIFLVAGALMASDAPPNYSGQAEVTEVDITVKESTEQPVKIVISHTFNLVTSSGSSRFDVASGEAYFIEFNLTVLDGSGRTVWENDSFFMAPLTHEFPQSATSDTEKSEQIHGVTLGPGKYSVIIASDHPVDYRIEQAYKAQALVWSLLAAGVLCMILIAGIVVYSIKKRDAQNRSRMIALYSSAPSPVSAYPNPDYAPAPPPPMYYPTGPAPPSTYPEFGGGQGPQPDDAARHSSLEYVPGGLYVEVVCTRCGWPIRSRPENGYVRCEHCGEVGYVQ